LQNCKSRQRVVAHEEAMRKKSLRYCQFAAA
jgi:hypothetical protein